MLSGISVTDVMTGGDVADFQWNGLLTDWRNEAIVKYNWLWVDHTRSYWKRVCVPELEYVEGNEEMVTPAQLDVEYGTIKFTTTEMLTKAEVDASLVYRE